MKMNVKLKKTVAFLLGMLLVSSHAQSQELTDSQRDVIERFITTVKTENWEELSQSISYPLRRSYPLPPVEDAADFLQRHNELFDAQFIQLLTESVIDSAWSEAGWRGIMFNNGNLWLDEEGTLIAMNYQPAIEKTKQNKLIEADRAALPISLRKYERPVLTFDTKDLHVRIDELEDGNFRYASWIISSKPIDVSAYTISENGVLEYDGSGGNHSYTFQVNDLTFVCAIHVLGTESTPPAELLIYQNENLLMTKAAVWLKN